MHSSNMCTCNVQKLTALARATAGGVEAHEASYLPNTHPTLNLCVNMPLVAHSLTIHQGQARQRTFSSVLCLSSTNT
jgi:hypothetical protein